VIREVQQAKPQLAELCRQHNVRRLEIFGGRARIGPALLVVLDMPRLKFGKNV
jgi:hypothetical protein